MEIEATSNENLRLNPFSWFIYWRLLILLERLRFIADYYKNALMVISSISNCDISEGWEIITGRLEGKVVLTSERAMGQGASEAKLFAEEGARVIFRDILDAEGRYVENEIKKTWWRCPIYPSWLVNDLVLISKNSS